MVRKLFFLFILLLVACSPPRAESNESEPPVPEKVVISESALLYSEGSVGVEYAYYEDGVVATITNNSVETVVVKAIFVRINYGEITQYVEILTPGETRVDETYYPLKYMLYERGDLFALLSP